jgi:uncharacterized protein
MIADATLHFHGDLNELLPPARRGQPVPYPLPELVAVKHAIEASGIPHTEVGAILVAGAPVDFAYHLQPGDQISVYPVGASAAAIGEGVLRPRLAQPASFVVDTHLGQLAGYLRLLGFDTLYRNDYEDVTLAEISHQHSRVLLTRDRGLLKRRAVIYGYCVRSDEPHTQLIGVLQRYRLAGHVQMGVRCIRCNGLLQPVAKEEIWEQLQPKTQRYYDDFHQCIQCGQIYWQGSHYTRMHAFAAQVLTTLQAK